MARINTASKSRITTHEGAPAKMINPEMNLRRSVMSCMLWENSFYEDGQEISERINQLVHANKAQTVADIAYEARTRMKLRHVPLLLMRELARHKDVKSIDYKTNLSLVIQRADELTEFLAIYWKDGKCSLSGQVKKGLAKAFNNFSAYDLAKYNRDNDIKLRDVLFLCHAKPINNEQEATWKQLIDGTLPIPDTWETNLSAGKDKKETWERLLSDNKLGALALIRNLRNMKEAKVSETAIFAALSSMKTERVLPFRFITSARYAPQWEPQLEVPMLKCLEGREKLSGKTIVLVDVSGSMDDLVSSKSDVKRVDCAAGVAILCREICEKVEVFTFSSQLVQVPARRGFALRDAIYNSQEHASTYLGEAISKINTFEYDRLIVITDEQSSDRVPDPKNKGYVINVATNKNGVGYNKWLHIDGFSESVIDYIVEMEKQDGKDTR